MATAVSTVETSNPVPAKTEEAVRPASSLREVLLLGAISCTVFLAVVARFDGYTHEVLNFGDNVGYLAVADGIKHWNFSGLTVKQFWGLPFLVAGISLVTGISSLQAQLLICFFCYFASLILVYRLLGERIAGLFAVLNFYWLQRCFLGGSEPLFVALLYASFLSTRRKKWSVAALLGALSATVRPLGFLDPLAIALVLLWRREYRKLVPVAVITACVGLAYVLALRSAEGDALATVHSYTRVGSAAPLFGFPFYAIVRGAFNGTVPATNLVLSLGWIGFTVGGTLLCVRSWIGENQQKFWTVEALFALGYLAMICSYNVPYWALGNFARFAIPLVPFAALGWCPWIPQSRWFLRGMALVSPALAACSSIGIVEVMHRLRG